MRSIPAVLGILAIIAIGGVKAILMLAITFILLKVYTDVFAYILLKTDVSKAIKFLEK